MGRFDSTYARLPVPMQNLAVSTYGLYWRWLRFGPGFSESVRGYRARERADAPTLRAWEDQRLRSILEVARRVPYYRETWTQTERRAAEKGDLSQLPILEKDVARAHPDRLCDPESSAGGVHIFHTSGTTGTPIATRLTTRELRDTQAVREVRSLGWAGVTYRSPRATFSGRIAVPDPMSQGPFHRFNLVERQAYLSPFHLRRETAGLYAEALRRHKIRWLTGYAVSYYLLAKFILQDGHPLPPLDAVVTTSEKVTAGMRSTMERAYGCRVYEEYSTVENALFVSECERGSLHVSSDFAIVEILRPDGEPSRPGEPGEVVATSLVRRHQPLIRFRLGDRAVWEEETCSCGRAMPVIREVLGRVEDLVVGPDGRQMVRFHGIFVDQPHVVEGQIIQEALTRIRVRVVPTEGFGKSDIDDIRGRVRKRLGPAVIVEVEPVSAIPRTVAGKVQSVVSRLEGRGVERTGIEVKPT